MGMSMLVDAIKVELVRLQLHPVNLDVLPADDNDITLRGSLLQYWKIPAKVHGQWLLEILQNLPDAAGPKLVMNALSTAQIGAIQLPQADKSEVALRLFDPSTVEGQPLEEDKNTCNAHLTN